VDGGRSFLDPEPGRKKKKHNNVGEGRKEIHRKREKTLGGDSSISSPRISPRRSRKSKSPGRSKRARPRRETAEKKREDVRKSRPPSCSLMESGEGKRRKKQGWNAPVKIQVGEFTRPVSSKARRRKKKWARDGRPRGRQELDVLVGAKRQKKELET